MAYSFAETVQIQSDSQTSEVTGSDPAVNSDWQNIPAMPGVCIESECISASSECIDVIEQNVVCDVDRTVQIQSERPPAKLEIDDYEKTIDFTTDSLGSRSSNSDVNNIKDANQAEGSIQEHWRPSNPFLGVANSNDTGGSLTPKSVSSSSLLQTLTPADISDGVTDSSPLSTSAPSDMALGYSKLHESAPSSLCSASPYESPTHAASGGGMADSTTGIRPDSLYLSRSILQERERQWLAKKGSYSSLSECDSSPAGSMDALIEVATSTPLHSQGTVSVEGDMITFVADGINELIKRSRGDSLAASERTSRTPRSTSTGSVSSSTSGWSASALSPGYSHATHSPSDQAQSPEDIPPIDPRVVYDLEQHARKVSDNLDSMMHSLTSKLHKMSSCTYHCLDVYKDSVDNTCDAVDTAIKSMYALMAKCEELSTSMAPIYKLREQICEIKRVLDLFEAKVATDSA